MKRKTLRETIDFLEAYIKFNNEIQRIDNLKLRIENDELKAENKRLSQVVEDTANMVKKIQEEL